MPLTTEYGCRIYNDVSGDYLSVAPDKDGLGLIEIESFAGDVKPEGRLVMNHENARKLAMVLNRVLDLNSNGAVVNLSIGGYVGDLCNAKPLINPKVSEELVEAAKAAARDRLGKEPSPAARRTPRAHPDQPGATPFVFPDFEDRQAENS